VPGNLGNDRKKQKTEQNTAGMTSPENRLNTNSQNQVNFSDVP